jgi:type I restriction enzyme S subunit
MSQYRAYPAYKDSGVEWIGQVPEHWKVKRESMRMAFAQ